MTCVERIEVEVFSNTVNAAVVRLPGRRFPGIVVQGDSLSTLASDVRGALDALRAGDTEEASAELESLHRKLETMLAVYEAALDEAGLALPYVRSDQPGRS